MTQRDPSSNMAMFSELEQETEYWVRVAGENSRGTGVFSEHARTTTHAGKLCTLCTSE